MISLSPLEATVLSHKVGVNLIRVAMMPLLLFTIVMLLFSYSSTRVNAQAELALPIIDPIDNSGTTDNANYNRLGFITVTLTSPEPGAHIAEAQTLELSAITEDPDEEVAFIIFYLYDGPQYSTVMAFKGEDGEYSAELENVEPGSYTLDAAAYGFDFIMITVSEPNFIDVVSIHSTPNPIYIRKGDSFSAIIDAIPIYDVDTVTYDSDDPTIVSIIDSPTYEYPYLFLYGFDAGETYISVKLNNTEWWTIPVIVYSISIEVDDNQCGIIGDMVPSNLGIDGIKHFVSPKGGGNVILKAVYEPANIPFTDLYEWAGVDPIEGHPDKVAIPRANAGDFMFGILMKKSGEIVDMFNVWIVWATFQTPQLIGNPLPSGFKIVNNVSYFVPLAWKLKFTADIQPHSIFTAADRPALDSPNSQPVPGGDVYAGGATKRWDISRRIRAKYIDNYKVLVNGDYLVEGTPYFANLISQAALPAYDLIIIDYPQDDVVGNDDEAIGDEDNNVYNQSSVGQIYSSDKPETAIRETAGQYDERIELRYNFGEFVRLQIGNSAQGGYKNWYKISDFCDWQYIEKAKRIVLKMTEDGTSYDFTNGTW